MSVELLEGAYDLHVHTGPDASPRKLDDIEYAERLLKIGMKGFGIKSHYFSTAGRASMINKLYPKMNAQGAITLNNTVGGLNPQAVDAAAKEGIKIVWMPTFNAENEINYMLNQASYEELPPWAKVELERKKAGKKQTTLTILDENGKLREEVQEIIDIVKAKDLILASGHLSKKEIFELAKATKEQNVRKFVVTHPTFSSVGLTKEEQKELTEFGALMELCFGTITPVYGITWEELYEHIRYIGPEHCLLSSDLGQVANPYPDEGMIEFVTNLLNNGFSKDEIRRMTAINTQYLVEN